MFRPVVLSPPTGHPQRWHKNWARLLTPLTIWIFSVSLRYGYYGDRRIVLGPGSSRLMKASSLFVRQVEVRADSEKGFLLYGFSEKPQLTHETNWTVSNFLMVGSYSRKGISLWLNKGSGIRMRWETRASKLNQTQLVIIKGEREFQTLLPKFTSSSDPPALTDPIDGKNAEYDVEEDDMYYFGVTNKNPRSITMTMNVNVTSKIYDLTKAKNMCSSSNGSCRLKLLFPNSQYVILTTPGNGDLDGWHVEVSFAARLIIYIAILGFITLIIFLVSKYLGACDGNSDNTDSTAAREVTETDPLVPEKPVQCTYGTTNNDEDDDAGSSSTSSEDLYDAKLCVICYDDQRNCFFVPCGHCATCYDCGQRIMKDDSKVCPICRRLIHKILLSSVRISECF
ncbi:E3 ubiquitin-protein ligase APD2 [Citrus sinensis]|uniref:E3 ubiquitin-protein ligase APD2 n=1 Tax=Citrus sinensis TaxID=2711 RepID=A0ACB8KML5_CITSI|nr:E3 ubiquitin-protein ligase APD2 [Citrus sinensis]